MASIAVSAITNEARYFLPTFMLFGFIIIYITLTAGERAASQPGVPPKPMALPPD